MDNYPKILIYLQNWSRPISRVLSRTTIHLGRTSPYASSDLPGPNAGRALGSLFGLAPGGVYPAAPVTGNAVRSYRTFSPLPLIAVRQPRAVCFLWHFPSTHPREWVARVYPRRNRGYAASCPVVFGLSSPNKLEAILRPSKVRKV